MEFSNIEDLTAYIKAEVKQRDDWSQLKIAERMKSDRAYINRVLNNPSVGSLEFRIQILKILGFEFSDTTTFTVKKAFKCQHCDEDSKFQIECCGVGMVPNKEGI